MPRPETDIGPRPPHPDGCTVRFQDLDSRNGHRPGFTSSLKPLGRSRPTADHLDAIDNSKSLFQKPYVVVRLRGRLYRNRSRYFAPVSRRSIN